MKFLFLPLVFSVAAFAGEPPVVTKTVQTYPDGRKVVVESTTTPPQTVRTYTDTVIPGKTTQTITELPPPIVVRQTIVEEVVPVRMYAIPAVAYVPVAAVPAVVVEKKYGFFGRLREVNVNGVTVEKRGPLGFRRD